MPQLKNDLETTLYLTIHGHPKKSVQEIADAIGISASYLYRSALTGESGCNFPLQRLIALMQATNDYRVLDHINARCNRVSVKLPQVSRLKRADTKAMHEIEGHYHKVIALVHGFFTQPDAETATALLAEIPKHVENMLAIKAAVRDYNQQEMEFTK